MRKGLCIGIAKNGTREHCKFVIAANYQKFNTLGHATVGKLTVGIDTNLNFSAAGI